MGGRNIPSLRENAVSDTLWTITISGLGGGGGGDKGVADVNRRGPAGKKKTTYTEKSMLDPS